MDIGELLICVLATTIRAGVAIFYATLGEIFTERSGILNLGVEGMMLMGAMSGFAITYQTDNLWLGVLASLGVGGLIASIHAFLTVTLRSNQVISGLALTIFGGGLASFLGKPLVGKIGPSFKVVSVPLLSKIPLLGKVFFEQNALVYLAYLLIPIAWFVIYRTKQGLHLRAVGENPSTADAMGINVFGTRYFYTILGGMLAGLGGAYLSLAYTPGWKENITSGRGWIAIALVIFAGWNPFRAVIGTILFGGINAIQFRMQAVGTSISVYFLQMLPYMVTIITLTWWKIVSRSLGPPAALGTSYSREEKG